MSDSTPSNAQGRGKVLRDLLRGIAWFAVPLVLFGMIPFMPSLVPSAERTLYFKLPIEGVRFHWRFLDPDAFLSGELTIRIINKGRDQTLVVFRDGKIQDGWEMIGDESPSKAFYFGFSTTRRYQSRADDSLIITLKAPKDLLGQGPFSEGVLAAGVWQMSGSYSSIYGRTWNPIDWLVLFGEPPVAFMECWAGVWPITITKTEGWKGPPPKEESTFLRRLFKERGTNGRLCRSHI